MQIHLVKTRYANAFVVAYQDSAFVIDVASGAQRYVLGFVEETLGKPVDTIALVACTHDDRDHMGGIDQLAALCNATLAVPYASGDAVHKLMNDPFGGLMRATTGFREALRARNRSMYINPERDARARQSPHYKGNPLDVPEATAPRRAIRLKDNDQLPGFEDWVILHTPGHSWDSCCYYHRETGSLISGDTLLGSRRQERVVKPAIYANRLHFSQTLSRLKSLDIRAVYPGHGKVIEGRNLLDDLS